MQKTIFLILVSFSLVLLSCEKKEEKAGLEIQPDENRLKVFYHTIDKFSSSSTYGDTVKTSKILTNTLLGSINDEVFGKSSAFFVSQYRLSSDNVSFDNTAQIVKTQLFLDVTGAVGDISLGSNIKIYESNYDLPIDSDTLISANEPITIGSLLADTNITISSSEDIEINLPNELFSRKIFDSANLEDNTSFIKEFKGLYFRVDTNSSQIGSIYKLDLNSDKSYIDIGYIINNNFEDTLHFKLQFNNKCSRFNLYFNNTSPLASILDPNSSIDSDEIYVSGIGGVKGKLNLSPVYTWRDSSDIIIYKAELLINSDTIKDIPAPNKLLLIKNKDEDGKLTYVDDYINGQITNYGGEVNKETLVYSMVITRHIQNLINNIHNDTIVEIIPNASGTNPYRVILKNKKDGLDDEKIILKITYSEIN